jgi:uncharacterized membrane protein
MKIFLITLLLLSILGTNIPSLLYAKNTSTILFITTFVAVLIQLAVMIVSIEVNNHNYREQYRDDCTHYNGTTNEQIVAGTVWTEHPEQNTGLGWIL